MLLREARVRSRAETPIPALPEGMRYPSSGFTTGPRTALHLGLDLIGESKAIFPDCVSSCPPALQAVSKILDVASLEVLSECNRRSLKKLASQADPTEQVDDTILT